MGNHIIKRAGMFLQRLYYPFVKNRFNSLTILSIEQTIDKIVNEGVSISRFGDGELRWLLNIKMNSFQQESELLSRRLAEVINSDQESDFLIGLPDSFRTTSQLKPKAKHFWQYFTVRYSRVLLPYLSTDKVYGNANISRSYMDYLDKGLAAKRFDAVRRIWKNKKILLVEGEESRVGVGNNLLSGAISIRRILCPPVNAFDNYSAIKESILESALDDELILLSLGPTATVLAYDIHRTGRQVIDFGQADIEYEWFLRGETVKIPIAGKYVNEVSDRGRHDSNIINDKKYLSEIIKVIG